MRQRVTSLMGTQCDTTSQESITKPVVRLEAKRHGSLDRHEKGGHVKRKRELRFVCRGGDKEYPQPVRVNIFF